MGKLFRYEFRKLVKSPSTYVCLILMCAFAVITVVTQNLILQMMVGVADIESSLVNGNDALLGALSGSKLTLMFPIVISIFVCSSYADGTIKNVVGHGYSRTKLYFGRYLVLLVSVLLMDLFSMLASWISGIVGAGIGYGYTGKYFLTILLQVLTSLAFATLFYFFAIIARKVSVSILLGIFVPTLVSLVLAIVDIFEPVPFTLSEYTVSGAFSTVNGGTIVTQADMLQVLIVCLCYMAVLLLGGWLIAGHQEI